MTTTPTTGAEMPEALRLALEALEHSAPTHKRYPEPRERHAKAIEAVRDALSASAVVAAPYAWAWKNIRTGGQGVYFKNPGQYGIMAHPDYEWTLLYTAPQPVAPQQGETAGAVYAELPEPLVERAADVTESDESYARHQGYVEGWNECLEAVRLAAAPHAAAASGAPVNREREIAIANAVLKAVEAINEGDENGRTYRAALGWVVAYLNKEVAAKLAYHDRGVSALPIARDALAKAESAPVAAAPMSAPSGVPESPISLWLVTTPEGNTFTVHRRALAEAESDYAAKVEALQVIAPASPTTVQAVVPMEWDEWRKQLAGKVDDYIQADHDGEGDDEAYADLKAHILKTPFAAPASGGEAQAEGVLAHLDALQDDAAAHIFPSDLERCMTSECCVEVASVRMGRPGERSVPLFSRQQVVDALAAAKSQKGAA